MYDAACTVCRTESDKNPYDATQMYFLYERGGLAILSPPLRDPERAVSWHLKAEKAAKGLPEEHRAGSAAVSAYNVACAYSLMEKKDEAFAALERSFGYTPGKPPVTKEHLNKDPDLDNLRGDERWKAFLAKHKMGAEAAPPKEADAPAAPTGPDGG